MPGSPVLARETGVDLGGPERGRGRQKPGIVPPGLGRVFAVVLRRRPRGGLGRRRGRRLARGRGSTECTRGPCGTRGTPGSGAAAGAGRPGRGGWWWAAPASRLALQVGVGAGVGAAGFTSATISGAEQMAATTITAAVRAPPTVRILPKLSARRRDGRAGASGEEFWVLTAFPPAREDAR